MAKEDAQEATEITDDTGTESPEAEVFSELDIEEEIWETEPTDDENTDQPDEENKEEIADVEEVAEPEEATEDPEASKGLTADQIQTLAGMGFDEADILSLKQSPLLDKIIDYGSDEPNKTTDTTTDGDEIPGSPDEKSEDGYKVTLDEDVYDPDLIQQFRSMKNHYDKKIAELNTVIHSLGDEAYTSRVDRLFADSGLDKFVGTGSTAELVPGTMEARNRRLIQDELVALTAGYEATGKDTPAFKELFHRAARAVLGDDINDTVRQEFVKKVESRHKQRIARPSNRASKSKGSVQQAVTSVSQMMKDRGMMDDNVDSFE